MAAYLELTIDQGTTFESEIELTDNYGDSINVANSVISGQIKKSYYSINPTETIQVIPVDAANGIVTLYMHYANTSNIKPGRYVYDVAFLNQTTDKRDRLIEGIVVINPQVTR